MYKHIPLIINKKFYGARFCKIYNHDQVLGHTHPLIFAHIHIQNSYIPKSQNKYNFITKVDLSIH